MTNPTKTLNTLSLLLDDLRRMSATTPAARSALGDALGHAYMAEEALRKAVAADAGKAETYAVTRADGKIVRVTVPA